MKMPQTIGLVHFIGIGGIGMSGIAEVLHNLGHRDAFHHSPQEAMAHVGVLQEILDKAAEVRELESMLETPCP